MLKAVLTGGVPPAAPCTLRTPRRRKKAFGAVTLHVTLLPEVFTV